MRVNARHLRPGDLAGLRWRGYIRESTEEQTERGTPPARQKADILRAVEELGMVGEPVWYERSGSGESVSEELQRALNDAGQYDVLVVFSTSRFARNRAEAVRMKAAFAEAGIIIYFASDRMISGARTSSLTEGIREVVDSEENETRRFYIAGGLRERQLAGKWVGSIPYGYRRHMGDNPDGSRSWDGTLESDPDEIEVVLRIFNDRLSGKSDGDIAHDLNTEGVRIRGGIWRRTAVRLIAGNPVYVGEMVRYRRPKPTHYFPESDPRDGKQAIMAIPTGIIAGEVWTAANQRRGPSRGPGRPYPLSRVLRCPTCDGPMNGCHSQTARYYRCYQRTVSGTCAAPYVLAGPVEDAFAGWLEGIKLPSDWREAIAKQQKPRVAEGKQAKLRAYLERLKALYLAEGLTLAEYLAERDKTKEQLAEEIPVNMTSVETLAAALSELGPLWRDDPRPTLPQLIVERATPRGRKLEVSVKAELRPLIALCLPMSTRLYLGSHSYMVVVRYV